MIYKLTPEYFISINPIDNGEVEYWILKEKELGGCIVVYGIAEDSFEAKKKAKDWLKEYLKEKEI